MPSGLSSPRSRAARAADLGERSVFVARQRVGKGPRRKARQRGRLRRVLPLTALAVAAPLAVAFSAHWLLTTPRFAVVSVDVRGASRVPTAEILAAAAVEPGTSLFRLDPGAVARRVEAIPEVRRADVVREFPNRIVISVEERRPFTLVHSGRLHWIDEEGRVLGASPEAVIPQVPVVSGLSDDELTSMKSAPSPKALAAIALIRALLRTGSALAAEISEIDMSRTDGPVLYTVDGVEVRLGAEDWEERLARLEGVLGQVADQDVRAVIAQPAAHGGLDVVGIGTAPSRGLRRGIVVNIDSTVEAIKAAVGEAEQMAGVEVAGVYAGVAGGHIRGVNSRGVVAVSGKDREVDPTDVARAVDAARAINLPQDREIIHVLPQNFIVDDGEGIRDPIGMSGVRLEVEVHVVTAAVTSVQNLVRSVNRAGLAVHDVILEPLASGDAVLYEDEKELGVVVVDIGGGTTDVALFRNGAIWHTAILPLGGDHISNDIAIGLRTPSPSAEDMKKRYGCALTALVPAEETVDVPSVGGRKPRQLSRQVLSEIIQPRVEEIFTLIARELGRAGLPDAATAGVVVTGGTSLMEGVSELAEAVFDQPVRRGVPLGVSGLADVVQSPIYATAAGLALHGVRGRAQAETAAATHDTRFGRLARGLSGLLNDIF